MSLRFFNALGLDAARQRAKGSPLASDLNARLSDLESRAGRLLSAYKTQHKTDPAPEELRQLLDQDLSRDSSLMTGRVYKKVIDKERAGGFLGKTVQVVPHVTNIIIEEIIECGKNSDIHIVEVGGTVGDIEGLHFIEAIRELGLRVGRGNFAPFQQRAEMRRAGHLPGVGTDFLDARIKRPVAAHQPFHLSLIHI